MELVRGLRILGVRFNCYEGWMWLIGCQFGKQLEITCRLWFSFCIFKNKPLSFWGDHLYLGEKGFEDQNTNTHIIN